MHIGTAFECSALSGAEKHATESDSSAGKKRIGRGQPAPVHLNVAVVGALPECIDEPERQAGTHRESDTIFGLNKGCGTFWIEMAGGQRR